MIEDLFRSVSIFSHQFWRICESIS